MFSHVDEMDDEAVTRSVYACAITEWLFLASPEQAKVHLEQRSWTRIFIPLWGYYLRFRGDDKPLGSWACDSLMSFQRKFFEKTR